MKKFLLSAAVLITASIATFNCAFAQSLTASMNVLHADDTSAKLHFTINCYAQTTTVKIDVINIETNDNVYQMPATNIGPNYAMFDAELDDLTKASGYRVIIKLGTEPFPQMEYFNTTGTADTTITTGIDEPGPVEAAALPEWRVVEMQTGKVVYDGVAEIAILQKLHQEGYRGTLAFYNYRTHKSKKYGF